MEPAREGLTDLSLEELGTLNVVFAASRYEQSLADAPAQVTIVAADEIRIFGYRTLADVLRSVPGLYVTYDRNYHYLGVRGFSPPGDYNARVLVLANGIRLNESVADYVGLGGDLVIDPDLIDRIEVLRGPGSSVYGTNAFLAVVNIVTKRPEDLNGTWLSGEIGSFATGSGSVSYGKRLRNGVGVIAAASAYRSGGPDLYFPEFDRPDTNNGIAAGVDDERTYRLFAQAQLKDLSMEASFADRWKVIPTGAWETVFNDPRTSTTDVHAYLAVKYSHRFAAGPRLVANLHLNGHDYDGTYIYAGETETDDPLATWDYGHARWWGGEVQLIHQLHPRHLIALGGEHRSHSRLAQGAGDEGGPTFEDRRSTDVWAVYGQDEVTLSNRVKANVGVRYDHYSTFGGTVNPRLALMFHPNTKTTAKVLYGRAFRAPNALELYYAEPLYYTPALKLKPEVIGTYEGLVERRIGDRLTASASVYHFDISHLIGVTTDSESGLLTYRNLHEANASGVELGLKGQWPGGTRTGVSYTYQHERARHASAPSPNSPAHLARFFGAIPILGNQLYAAGELQYSSPRLTINSGSTEDAWLANLTLSSAWQHRVQLAFSVYNALDRSNGHPGSEEQVARVIPQDGRGFRLKLGYRF